MRDVAGELDSAALDACGSSLKAAAAECETDWEATAGYIYDASEHLAAASKEDGPLPGGARPKLAAAAEALRSASECGGALRYDEASEDERGGGEGGSCTVVPFRCNLPSRRPAHTINTPPNRQCQSPIKAA